jgi:hypothetical protein
VVAGGGMGGFGGTAGLQSVFLKSTTGIEPGPPDL